MASDLAGWVERVTDTGVVLEAMPPAHDAVVLSAQAVEAYRAPEEQIELEFLLFEDQEAAKAAARAIDASEWARAPIYRGGISGAVLIVGRAQIDDEARRDALTGMLSAFAGEE